MNATNPISEARSNAARENGKKSHGPVTPEGKEKSRMNAVKFGFYSAQEIVLKTESADQFERFRESYYHEYQPDSDREAELVEQIACCAWRLRRIPILEAQSLGNPNFPTDTAGQSFAHCLNYIGKLDRHDRSLRKTKKEAMDELELCQTQKPQNEPNEELERVQKLKWQNEPKTLNPGNIAMLSVPENAKILGIEKCQNEPKKVERPLTIDELAKNATFFNKDRRLSQLCANEVMTRFKRSDPAKYATIGI